MEFYILLENNSIDAKLKSNHGLSLLIKYKEKNILLDVGPNGKFIRNAEKMNIDLKDVDLLFLSHSHNDHTGGLNNFFKVNNKSVVYLMDKISSRYYIKHWPFNISIGLKIRKKYNSKITQLSGDLVIDDGIYFLKNSISNYQKPNSNGNLFKKDSSGIVPDTFDHEGILVIEDKGELIVFNSCSHNGILNIIETVETRIPNKKIRAYVGGLHLSNPGTKQHESDEYLDTLIKQIAEKGITVYTGHCTGRYAIDYLKNGLKEKLREINTGMRVANI